MTQVTENIQKRLPAIVSIVNVLCIRRIGNLPDLIHNHRGTKRVGHLHCFFGGCNAAIKIFELIVTPPRGKCDGADFKVQVLEHFAELAQSRFR